jgi:hypothetical protein
LFSQLYIRTHFLSLSWPAGHTCSTYTLSLQIYWDNSVHTSSCCHLPWNIRTPWKQSECIFPRNSRVQMLLCATLCGWLLWCTFNQFWLYFSEISVVGAFIFSELLFKMRLSETFFILRRIYRDMMKNLHLSSCKVSVILVRFELNLNFLHRFSKNAQISNFIKIRTVGAELINAHRRTDGRTVAQTWWS